MLKRLLNALAICKEGAEDVKHLMFTGRRAHQVWSSMGLLEAIKSVLPVDRLGSIVLEEILRNQNPNINMLGQIGYKEAIAVGVWYIWCGNVGRW